MTFLFNSALCLDLILVLHSPFKSAEARTPKYFWFCLIVTVATWLCTGPYLFIPPYGVLWDYIQCANVIVFMASALLSGIYATYKLTQPGISSEIRSVILRRHIITIAYFIFTNFYLIYSMLALIIVGY